MYIYICIHTSIHILIMSAMYPWCASPGKLTSYEALTKQRQLFHLCQPFPTLLILYYSYARRLPEATGRREKQKRNPISNKFRTNLVLGIFTIYLSNFVYWVGFGAVMAFKTHLWIVDFVDFCSTSLDHNWSHMSIYSILCELCHTFILAVDLPHHGFS